MSSDRDVLQQAISEVIRDQAEDLAARVIDRLAGDAPAQDQESTEEYARVLTVDGANGPAILADYPACEVELFRVESFYDQFLDAQHIWDSSQHAELQGAADHDLNHHAPT